MPISSREELKDYCLRRLGHPVIEINVDDDQVEDRIQDAIEFWQEYHFDGVEKVYLREQITESTLTFFADVSLYQTGETVTGSTSGATAIVNLVDIPSKTLTIGTLSGTFSDGEIVTGGTSGATVLLIPTDAFFLGSWDSQYLTVSDAVTGISRIFPIGGQGGGSAQGGMFNIMYQFRLNDMWSLMSTDLIYYSQVKQHIEMLGMLFSADRSFRFNRKQNRIYLDVKWDEVLRPGDWVVAEAYRILNPNQFTEVYNDIFLKRYATALIKRQWGNNMKKFSGIQLPGGVTLNGAEVYLEATTEIEKIEEEMQLRYELPPNFLIG